MASARIDSVDGDSDDRYPIRRTFFGCCASAATQRTTSMAHRVRTVIFLFMSFEVSNVEPLLNDFIRSRQHIRRNGYTDLLGRFQIDDELELLRLLDGQVTRLRTF